MIKYALFSTILAITLAGCGVKPPVNARQDPYLPRQVHLASEDLRKNTAFSAPVLSRDEGKLLFIDVPVRAATDLKLYIDYRVSFFDKNNQLIYQTAWFSKTLEPNIPDHLTANSVTARAVDFQMDIRYSN